MRAVATAVPAARSQDLSPFRPRCRGVCVKRLTNQFGAWHKHRYNSAFTVLELLIVISIIIVLAGLTLATMGYVQKKGARSRAEAEIAAISAALESYKADNGVYPRNTDTDSLDARSDIDPNNYAKSSLFLYTQLSGTNPDHTIIAGAKSYFAFKPNMLMPAPPSTANIIAVRDPFGNSYAYSTAYAADLEKNPGTAPTRGYNPTFDLWSTAGGTSAADIPQWIKNW